MNQHSILDTAEELGQAIFYVMTELVQVQTQPNSTHEDVEAARRRYMQTLNEIADALWDSNDFASYDAGLRSAVFTHLNHCATVRDALSIFVPLTPEQVHRLRERGQAIRDDRDGLTTHLDSIVKDAVAEVFEAQARLGEVLHATEEPTVLLL